MKKLLTTIAASAALMSTPAIAGEVKVDVRQNGILDGQSESQQFQLGFKDSYGLLTYGADVRVKQADGEGDVGTKVTAKFGPNLSGLSILGFKPSVLGQVGRNLQENKNYTYWGVEVGLKRNIVGPVSAQVVYRHREGFDYDYNSERVMGGLSYRISENNSLGVGYYHYFDGTDVDSIGLSFSHKM